ncbi:VSP [Giardia duodenalis ATCC 50581]|uniref:VSP n=1 Tax=Giardia intestinalis (strain ATCC 50581 / GS clone H7) TaxID=598745 RepID=C6LMR0_GIAIB|nr:VSP [Giardia intestinalis ATCC 50581]
MCGLAVQSNCSQCVTPAEYLINGACSTANTNDACASGQPTDGTCKSCKTGYFLYEGGCYAQSSPPGNIICQAAGDTAGVCGECKVANGFFKNPDTAAKQSCIACNRTEPMGLVVGVADCSLCTAPSVEGATSPKAVVCTKCDTTATKYLKKADDGTTTCVAENQCDVSGTAYYKVSDATKGNKCISCSDAAGITDAAGETWKGVTGCAKCTKPGSAGAAICTECQADKYLKAGDTPSCVRGADCNTEFFPVVDESENNKKVCVSCGTGNKGGITNCKTCSPKTSAAKEGAKITCTECTANNLSPLKDECMATCPAGTYVKNKVCAPCHASCASCQADDTETSCTACYPGYSLLYGTDGSSATGRCVKECTGEFGVHCITGQCDGVVGGSRYCKKCEHGYVPIDGVCTATGAVRSTSMCTAGEGVCTGCTGDYALLSSGCYNTKKLPGSSVCTAASNGACTTCAANSKAPAGGSSCPTCPDGCAKCSDSSACSECLPGYYKGTGNKCFKCTEGDNASSNAITGVESCVSCAPPSGGAGGPVTCYIKADNNSDGSGGDTTNKGGLPTGAIAGISVAVIAVVGGLVGFLCWWFVCRGKA